MSWKRRRAPRTRSHKSRCGISAPAWGEVRGIAPRTSSVDSGSDSADLIGRLGVRGIAPRSRIEWVRGLTSPGCLDQFDKREARRSFELPEEGPIVLVSGGGWAVGNLAGAAEVALRVDGTTVVCMCGRNDRVREEIDSRFAGEPRLRTIGFTDRMCDLMAAGDVLIHSTAGLTVLEALMRGTSPISFGWGMAHIRINNREFARHGLADVAQSPDELGAAIERALANPRQPDRSAAERPTAASVVLDVASSSA